MKTKRDQQAKHKAQQALNSVRSRAKALNLETDVMFVNLIDENGNKLFLRDKVVTKRHPTNVKLRRPVIHQQSPLTRLQPCNANIHCKEVSDKQSPTRPIYQNEKLSSRHLNIIETLGQQPTRNDKVKLLQHAAS